MSKGYPVSDQIPVRHGPRGLFTWFSLGLVTMPAIVFLFAGGFIDLQTVQASLETLEQWVARNPAQSFILLFIIRLLFAVISIPGTGVITVLAGALFGFWLGVALVWTAVVVGVSAVFLISRFAARDLVWLKLKNRMPFIENGVAEYGSGFLFLLRIVEVFPSFIINSAFALTPMKFSVYAIISALSVTPGILVFVHAGQRIRELETLAGLMDVTLFLALTAIGMLPLLGRWTWNRVKHRFPPSLTEENT